MNSQASLCSPVPKIISAGLVKTLLAIAVYRLLVEQIETTWKYRLFTLILIITPIMLYLTMKKLVAMHWNYQLKFFNILITGVLFTVAAGTGIATLDYLILVFKVPGFESAHAEYFQTPFLKFLFIYLTWYGTIGVLATPVVYLVLWWQLRNSR